MAANDMLLVVGVRWATESKTHTGCYMLSLLPFRRWCTRASSLLDTNTRFFTFISTMVDGDAMVELRVGVRVCLCVQRPITL